MEYKEFMELVEKCTRVFNGKPAFWFEVRVVIPKEVVKQIKAKKQLTEGYLEVLAKSLAQTKIAKLFEEQGLFYEPYRIHAEKSILTTEDTYEVSLIYCWG